MRLYTLTTSARHDLSSIWRYIAKDSPRHADMVEAAVLETCRSIAAVPGMGHRRKDVHNPNIFFVAVHGFERYSIAFMANSKPVSVLRVIHGMRNVPVLFR